MKLKSILLQISELGRNEHVCLQIKYCFQQPPVWDFALVVLRCLGIASHQYCHSSSGTSTVTGSASTQALPQHTALSRLMYHHSGMELNQVLTSYWETNGLTEQHGGRSSLVLKIDSRHEPVSTLPHEGCVRGQETMWGLCSAYCKFPSLKSVSEHPFWPSPPSTHSNPCSQ